MVHEAILKTGFPLRLPHRRMDTSNNKTLLCFVSGAMAAKSDDLFGLCHEVGAMFLRAHGKRLSVWIDYRALRTGGPYGCLIDD